MDQSAETPTMQRTFSHRVSICRIFHDQDQRTDFEGREKSSTFYKETNGGLCWYVEEVSHNHVSCYDAEWDLIIVLQGSVWKGGPAPLYGRLHFMVGASPPLLVSSFLTQSRSKGVNMGLFEVKNWRW